MLFSTQKELSILSHPDKNIQIKRNRIRTTVVQLDDVNFFGWIYLLSQLSKTFNAGLAQIEYFPDNLICIFQHWPDPGIQVQFDASSATNITQEQSIAKNWTIIMMKPKWTAIIWRLIYWNWSNQMLHENNFHGYMLKCKFNYYKIIGENWTLFAATIILQEYIWTIITNCNITENGSRLKHH